MGEVRGAGNEARCDAPVLFSIVESPGHPNLSPLYRRLGITEVRLASQRKAVQALKRHAPDFVVAEFFYGFGNNYAGANLSNLDVFLASLQRYAPNARVIVLVQKDQRGYVDRLAERFRLYAILVQPVSAADLEPLLRG
jgi:AmiR/NasT family two-component response regulator